MVPIIAQRRAQDCGVAALAQFAEIRYEDAYVAVAKVDSKYRGGRGLLNREIVAAAKHLGITLTPTRKFDLDDDEGVLGVKFNGAKFKNDAGHFVSVKDGQIYCPEDQIVYRWRDYLERWDARPCTLLKGVV